MVSRYSIFYRPNKEYWKLKKVIKEINLDWNKYLEENGVQAKYYNINEFSTDFQLDIQTNLPELIFLKTIFKKFCKKIWNKELYINR
jgi:hypothetical protein